MRALVSAELEKLPRVKAEPGAHAPRISFLDHVLATVQHTDGADPKTASAAESPRRRYRLIRWNERDRRVQRLRGWLSGATG